VVVAGAGGIGFDIAEFLVHDGASPTLNLDEWLVEWGVVDPAKARGGIALEQVRPEPKREVTLLQRKTGKHGATLGKTTGWIHRATLKMNDVRNMKVCPLCGGVSRYTLSPGYRGAPFR